MIEPVDETLRRWLATESQIADRQIAQNQMEESQGLEVVAEQTLSELMRALPEARLRPGFADRVMAASGLERRFSRARLWDPRKVLEWLFVTSEDVQGKPARLAASVVLLLVGSAVAGLPSLVLWFAEVVSLVDIVSRTAHFFTLAASFLATVMTFGRILLALYDALLLVLVSPPVMLTSFAAFILTTFTLRWLTQLLSSTPPHSALSQRSNGYVPTH